jgi:ubiquinone/menaquinone biosynthesis C-methylase UbiE
VTTKAEPAPGFRDLDRSSGFAEILASLDHFNKAPYVRAARRALYRLLRPGPGMQLLDAGCGPGLDIAALAPKVIPGGRAVGLDLSQRMIDLAHERYGDIEGAEFKQGSVEAIPFPDNTFDGAFSMRTLQYLDEPEPAVAEMARVTKPGGRVVLIEGGVSAIDLPDSELTRFVFGPRPPAGRYPLDFPAPASPALRSMGLRMPRLLLGAGLTDVVVRPGFGATVGQADAMAMKYVRSMTEVAVEDGVVSEAEASAWLASLEAVSASGAWFTVDLMLVVAGTVPAR